MFFVDELTPLKLYPVSKKVHIPIDEKDKRNGAAIMLLTPNEDDSIKLMTHPSIINRRNYISAYADKSVDAIINHEGKIEDGEIIQEAKLPSQERRKLPDSEFGLPEQRKYPLNDKSHVLAAIRMFNHADDSDQAELAKNIKKKIKYFNMEDEVSIGKDNAFSKYYNESFDPSFKEDTIIKEDIMFKPNEDGAKFVFCSGTLTAINDASKVLNTNTLKELYRKLNNDKSAKIKRAIKVYIHDSIKEEQEYKNSNDIHCARAYGFDEELYGPYNLYLKNKLAQTVIKNMNPDVNDYICNYTSIWLSDQIDVFKTRSDVYWSGAHAIELTVKKYGVQSIRDIVLHNDTSKIMKVAMSHWLKSITELLPYQKSLIEQEILMDKDNLNKL